MKWFLRTLSFLIGLMPEPMVRFLAGVVGVLLHSVVRYRRSVVQDNLRHAFPNTSEQWRARVSRLTYRHLALTLFEFLRIPRYAAESFRGQLRVEGLEHFRAAQAKGKGVLFLTGHMGSFELGAGAMAHAHSGEKFWLIVKSYPGSTDEFMGEVRRTTDLELLPDRNAMRDVRAALSRNESVVFVLDQNSTRKIGVFVDFFGRKACTMSGLAVTALRTRAPVIPVAIRREPDGSHVLQMFEEIPIEKQDDLRASVQHMTQVYTRFIEDRIRAHPEQWLWTHRRWRTRPAEEMVPPQLSTRAGAAGDGSR